MTNIIDDTEHPCSKCLVRACCNNWCSDFFRLSFMIFGTVLALIGLVVAMIFSIDKSDKPKETAPIEQPYNTNATGDSSL